MAESNSLLNCRTGNRTAGSNPALSAIFLSLRSIKKNIDIIQANNMAASHLDFSPNYAILICERR